MSYNRFYNILFKNFSFSTADFIEGHLLRTHANIAYSCLCVSTAVEFLDAVWILVRFFNYLKSVFQMVLRGTPRYREMKIRVPQENSIAI
jgi:hypothetical protein